MSERDARLAQYVSETLRFSRALNLTSVKDAGLFRRRFIAPSLALLEWIPETGVLLDAGSGMGVPGVPLLLARPGLRGCLVERRRKRAEFLRHVVRTLALNASVFDCDVRALDGVQADILVARAVTRPGDLLAMCAPLVREGGMAVLPTALDMPPADAPGWRFLGAGRVPLDGGAQSVQRYRRMEGFT